MSELMQPVDTQACPESVREVVGERYRAVDVPVRGGTMRVGIWAAEQPDAPVVLAVHGITSSHLAFTHVVRLLPGVTVVAPDLRGRGMSNRLPGPYGMVSHAEDVAAVLTALDLPPVTVVGHSMGGFVAVVLADRHPEMVRSLVLVDGGMPLLPPEGVAPDQLAQAILGPAADRLRMTFADRDSYRTFWREHPAFSDFSPELAAYVDYDLQGEPGRMEPATRVAALEGDIAELVGEGPVQHGLSRLRHDTVWLVAPRGLQNEVPPLYPEAARELWTSRLPQVELVPVPEVNHYTIVMSPEGAGAIPPWVERALPEG